MGDPILTQDPPPSLPSDDFDSLAIPPLDPLFNFGEDSYDFDISFDDLDNFGELYLPSENEQFIIPGPSSLQSQPYSSVSVPDLSNSSASPASDSSEICADHVSDVDKYLNPSPSEAGSCDSGSHPSPDSVRVTNAPSPVSSHGSGNGESDVVSEPMNAGSPDSGNFVVEQKIKLVVDGKGKSGSVSKRKKETAEDAERSQKYQRAEISDTNIENIDSEVLNEGDEKRRARLMRNRESAQLSRQRKKHYVEELEDKVRAMHSTIADLNGKISFFMAENVSLRQQLTGAGNNSMRPSPPPGAMYPPMVGYPWMPCAPPYVVKHQGSQVPLVPIPRLKQPQQPAQAPRGRKGESKKSESRTKKVASVSFLGLIFFVLLFGGLVPIVDFKFGGVSEGGLTGFGFTSQRSYDQHKGRVLMVDGDPNGSCENIDGKVSSHWNNIHCERARHGVDKKGGHSDHSPNVSEPLVASLYVPRNDKLVKIDGNLIIHSVLASERAMASRKAPEVKISKETGLAIPRHLSPALANRVRHSHVYRNPAERQKALTSEGKSSAANGKLQQWFREGLAGPLLSSGMCSEVFQFDVSPAPGSIVPASSVANITTEGPQNATHLKNGKNRRTLRGVPIPLPGSDLNVTSEHFGRSSEKGGFQGNKSASTMVVSLLVDPREAGDSDVDGVINRKSLSRIFVVVLLDSIKYVTYSCALPSLGPHLVTT